MLKVGASISEVRPKLAPIGGEEERAATGVPSTGASWSLRGRTEGDEKGSEEWMSPRRDRLGVEPPDLSRVIHATSASYFLVGTIQEDFH
jgi:hypothetical protein